MGLGVAGVGVPPGNRGKMTPPEMGERGDADPKGPFWVIPADMRLQHCACGRISSMLTCRHVQCCTCGCLMALALSWASPTIPSPTHTHTHTQQLHETRLALPEIRHPGASPQKATDPGCSDRMGLCQKRRKQQERWFPSCMITIHDNWK